MINNSIIHLIHPQDTNLPVELVPPQSVIANPTSWLRDGNSPAEIILAVAVLIGSLTGLVKVLLPLLLKKTAPKN